MIDADYGKKSGGIDGGPKTRFPDEGFVPIKRPVVYMPKDLPGAAGCPSIEIHTPGYKLDYGKLRYDLLPPDILEAITWTLTWACSRTSPPPYPERNWEKGMSWLKVFAALMRHLWAWRRGENSDPESGKSHLWHAACCITFLVTYERTHPELDDRKPDALHQKSFPQPDGFAYRSSGEAGSDPRRP